MFNAVSYVKEMRKAGFTEQQAEILMQCQIDVMNSHFATGEDISELKGELKKDIGALDKKIDGINKDLNSKIDGINKDLNSKIDGIKKELNSKIDNVQSNLQAEFKADTEDLKNKLGGIVVSCTIILGVILKLT